MSEGLPRGSTPYAGQERHARVLVTGPPPGGPELADLLAARGVRAEVFEAIEILPPEDAAPLAVAAMRAARGDFDWIVLTSARGVRALARALSFVERSPQWSERSAREGRAHLEGSPRAQIATVGAATAAAAEREGWSVQLVPESYSTEGLLQSFGSQPSWDGIEVLMPVADRASEELPAGLRALGARVQVVSAYRTVARTGPELERVRSLLQERSLDLVTFSSPSAAESLLEGVGTDALSVEAAVIGPATARVAERLGYRVVTMAEPHTTAGLASAVLGWLGRERP
jgi:uroporphyrinogen-III synthase